VREKTEAANPVLEGIRLAAFVISERYCFFSLSWHTLSGMRDLDNREDNKTVRFCKVLSQERSEWPLLQSRRESTGEGSHRSQRTRKQRTGAGKQQAWSVGALDRGHTGAGKNKTSAADQQDRVCKQWAQAWAHNWGSGGFANHSTPTYTAPGLPSRYTDFFPLSRRSQAILEPISDRLGIWHLPRPSMQERTCLGSGRCFFLRRCANAGMGKRVCARGLGSRAHQLSRYLGESIASDLPEVCQQRVFVEVTKTARSGGTNSRISSPQWRRGAH